MAVYVNIEDLISGKTIESERIEFKKDGIRVPYIDIAKLKSAHKIERIGTKHSGIWKIK